MPYTNKINRNAAQRAYRASKKLTKPKDSTGKTPFASFVHIPPGRIEALADDVYQVNIVMGPLTFRYRKYDSNSGQLFMFKHGDEANALAGAWYASVLRPMIVAAIEAKFDVELTHFDDAKPIPVDKVKHWFPMLWSQTPDHDLRTFLEAAVDRGAPLAVARQWLIDEGHARLA